METVQLTHTGAQADSILSEVETARGAEASLSAKIATKQDTLTFDPVPTASSTNPVASGGVWTPMAYLVDSGAKNCANWNASTQTVNNVTFTVSGDTVTATLPSGESASARSQKALNLADFDTLPAGSYVISGAPTMTAGGLYVWDVTAGTRISQSVRTNGEGMEFDFSPVSGHTYNITVDIPSGYAVGTGLTFRPMICAKAAWDISHDYVPYCPTMAELYAMIQALQSGTRSMRTEPEETTGEEER